MSNKLFLIRLLFNSDLHSASSLYLFGTLLNSHHLDSFYFLLHFSTPTSTGRLMSVHITIITITTFSTWINLFSRHIFSIWYNLSDKEVESCFIARTPVSTSYLLTSFHFPISSKGNYFHCHPKSPFFIYLFIYRVVPLPHPVISFHLFYQYLTSQHMYYNANSR